MSQPRKASEKLTLQECLAKREARRAHDLAVLARLRGLRPLAQDAAILDLGAGQGLFLITCAEQGLRACGVEPWGEAREVAARLAAHFGVEVEIRDGVAEKIPWGDGQFDLVLADSVVEHVQDAAETFREAYRVLKPGGVFWFAASSSMCPRQAEISVFPCFGWYPDRLKRRIMAWAVKHRPGLVGHTATPAIHWFTPWKARRMLCEAGFRRVYDRWDIRLPSEGGRLYRVLLRAVRLCAVTKFLADVCIAECAYAAVK